MTDDGGTLLSAAKVGGHSYAGRPGCSSSGWPRLPDGGVSICGDVEKRLVRAKDLRRAKANINTCC